MCPTSCFAYDIRRTEFWKSNMCCEAMLNVLLTHLTVMIRVILLLSVFNLYGLTILM